MLDEIVYVGAGDDPPGGGRGGLVGLRAVGSNFRVTRTDRREIFRNARGLVT